MKMEQILIFIFGVFFGSFANVCIRRIPYGNSIVKPASHCPKCLVPIRWRDNIPVFSYIFLKGKCRICLNPIPFQYPAVEFVTGLFFLLSYYRFGITSMLVISLLLGLLLIVISFIDFNLRVVPDILSVALFIAGVVLSPLNDIVNRSIKFSLLGVLLGGLSIYLIAFIGEKIYRKEVMGGGDVKLLAAGGSFIGIKIVYALLIACFLGSFFGILLILLRKRKISDFVPFGPYIAAGILLIFFFDRIITRMFSFLIS